MAEFERSHEALVEQYNMVIWFCSSMLVAEVHTLNDLDRLPADKKELPPPEPIEKERFCGRRCASTYREFYYEPLISDQRDFKPFSNCSRLPQHPSRCRTKDQDSQYRFANSFRVN